MIGHVLVVEGGRVGVVAQRRRCISVPEPRLSLEDLALADEIGPDAVAEAVQRSVRESGGLP